MKIAVEVSLAKGLRKVTPEGVVSKVLPKSITKTGLKMFKDSAHQLQ
jgi:hypothetical protein